MNSTMDLSLLCLFIHISGDNIRENYRYKFSPPFNLSGNLQNWSDLYEFFINATNLVVKH